jgi:signal transduction histidine kinase
VTPPDHPAAAGSRLDTTLDDVVQAAMRHVDAEYGVLGVLTPDGRTLDRYVVTGTDQREAARVGRSPSGEGILRVPVRVGDAVFGHLHLAEKRSGGPFTPADLEIAQAMATVAGLAIDNAREVERFEHRGRWGQAATDMATALLSGAEPDEVLRSMATKVAELSAADVSAVLAPSLDDDDSLTIVAAEGRSADDVEGVRVPLQGTYVGSTHQAGARRLIDDISTVPVVGRRVAAVVELTAGYGPALVVPVGSPPDRDLLVAMRATGREPFTREDLDLLTTFATRSSVVLELARAQQRERQLRLQADRDRIARDLHDHVVQRIFATALSLDRLSRSLSTDQPEAAARLSGLVDELDGTMAEIRSAIFELQQDTGPEPSTVRRQLTDVVRQATEGHALQRDVRFRGAVDELPRELIPDLIAVIRELVTNVVRHAGARRVTVTVSAGDEVRVAVTDDGCGLPSVTVRSGLANLTDRAERRGGRFSIRTGASGTEIRWIAPLVRAG